MFDTRHLRMVELHRLASVSVVQPTQIRLIAGRSAPRPSTGLWGACPRGCIPRAPTEGYAFQSKSLRPALLLTGFREQDLLAVLSW